MHTASAADSASGSYVFYFCPQNISIKAPTDEQYKCVLLLHMSRNLLNNGHHDTRTHVNANENKKDVFRQ
jgi:hypothetical protein